MKGYYGIIDSEGGVRTNASACRRVECLDPLPFEAAPEETRKFLESRMYTTEDERGRLAEALCEHEYDVEAKWPSEGSWLPGCYIQRTCLCYIRPIGSPVFYHMPPVETESTEYFEFYASNEDGSEAYLGHTRKRDEVLTIPPSRRVKCRRASRGDKVEMQWSSHAGRHQRFVQVSVDNEGRLLISRETTPERWRHVSLWSDEREEQDTSSPYPEKPEEVFNLSVCEIRHKFATRLVKQGGWSSQSWPTNIQRLFQVSYDYASTLQAWMQGHVKGSWPTGMHWSISKEEAAELHRVTTKELVEGHATEIENKLTKIRSLMHSESTRPTTAVRARIMCDLALIRVPSYRQRLELALAELDRVEKLGLERDHELLLCSDRFTPAWRCLLLATYDERALRGVREQYDLLFGERDEPECPIEPYRPDPLIGGHPGVSR
jgi:hypothetical protein